MSKLRTVPLTGASEQEIRREFQVFREASVRLAERVRDLSIEDSDPVAAARADLHLVRSIFGKWSSDVLIALHALPTAGFEELRRNLNGISPRVLSLKLKELEQNGMVQREILDTRPPRVRYSLTDRGWTVAWLSQPVLLYLRFTDERRASPLAAGTEPVRPTEQSGAPFRPIAEPLEPEALGGRARAAPREAARGTRAPIGSSRVGTVVP
ncbi:MAG: helix-turn-helix transcriptional regulator [Thermoplasmata archaeon]|nr:helix-turn-helix transcriptional regulator [Thermoplasmata archaeon]